MLDITNDTFSENCEDNTFELFPQFHNSLNTLNSNENHLLNDIISLSHNQGNSEYDFINNFEESSCNSYSSFIFQNNNSFWEDNKDIEKDEKDDKKKEKFKGNNNILNNKNNDNNSSNLIGKKRDKKHDKTAKDNIKRKIQVNYIKFLKNLLNQINIELLCNYKNNENIQFFPLNYKFIKLVSKKFFDSLKKQTLGDIFKYNVSPKFKNYQNLNIQVYNEITDKSETIKAILNKTYLEFFDVYYLNKKTINLSKYGLDKTIELSSNIGFYEDLLKKNGSDFDGSTEDEIYYRKKIEKCIKTEFMISDRPIFFVQ